VNLTGTLANSGQTMLFNDVTGSWILQGGTVSGGTLAATIGRALVVSGGTLAGVTLDNSGGNASPLDLTVINGGTATIKGDLLLHNVVVHLGQSTGFQFGQLNFSSAGSQVLDAVPGSTGTIDLGLSGNNGISFNGSVTGDQFIIGAAITVQGTAGFISTSSSFRLDNKGTITADPTILGTSAGTVSISGGSNWLNEGTI